MATTLRAFRRAQPHSQVRPAASSEGPEGRDARATRRLDAFIASLRLDVDSSPTIALAASQIFKEFEPAGVAALLLKGAALARLLYEDGERRSYVDLDLLVAPRNLGAAGKVLSELGYLNTTEALGIDDVGGVVHADTWRGVPRGGEFNIPVELHRWLAGARATPEKAWEALWRRRMVIDLEGAAIPVLPREGQALHVALHAGQHGPDYRRGLAELRLALERWAPEVWLNASGLAEEIDAVDAFAVGLRLVPEGAQLATNLHLPATRELDWEMSHRGERPRGAFHVEAFRTSTTVRDRLGLVRRALLPNRRWLASEYHWAEQGRLRMVAAYGLHLLRAPVWGARAWRFRRRARRGA